MENKEPIRYRKFKFSDKMTPAEIKTFKETEFDFDPALFGSFVLCDSIIYTDVPPNCKPETIPISFKNGDCRADGIADGFMDELECVYVSEHEMEIGICMEWPL